MSYEYKAEVGANVSRLLSTVAAILSTIKRNPAVAFLATLVSDSVKAVESLEQTASYNEKRKIHYMNKADFLHKLCVAQYSSPEGFANAMKAMDDYFMVPNATKDVTSFGWETVVKEWLNGYYYDASYSLRIMLPQYTEGERVTGFLDSFFGRWEKVEA